MDVELREDPGHRHGRRVHSHPHSGPHRHATAPRLSRPLTAADGRRRAHPPGHGPHGDELSHGHSHGLADESIVRSRGGIRAVALSLAALGLAAAAQAAVFALSGSIALLADVIHNGGDALTAVPLGIAFALRSHAAERAGGLAVVAAIFISACVAGASRRSCASSTRAPRRT